MPEEDAVGVNADAGCEAVGKGTLEVGAMAIEEQEEGDSGGVGEDPVCGDGEQCWGWEAEVEESGDYDHEPKPTEVLELGEAVGECMVEDGQEDAVEDSVDAGVGCGEGGEACGG